MLVVLPVPLTPTTRTTAGTSGAGLRGQGVGSRGANNAMSSAWSASSGGRSRRARALPTTSMVRSAPRSARDERLLDTLPGGVVGAAPEDRPDPTDQAGAAALEAQLEVREGVGSVNGWLPRRLGRR